MAIHIFTVKLPDGSTPLERSFAQAYLSLSSAYIVARAVHKTTIAASATTSLDCCSSLAKVERGMAKGQYSGP